MSLFEKLKLVKSEEDVKDIYIKALGLKGYSKNLIDIQTKKIWFEAKDNHKLLWMQLLANLSPEGTEYSQPNMERSGMLGLTE